MGMPMCYETKIEEVLEREIAINPSLLDDIIAADKEWTTLNRERVATRDSARTFADVHHGQVWREHAHLGNPDYSGPTQLAPVAPPAQIRRVFVSTTSGLRCFLP